MENSLEQYIESLKKDIESYKKGTLEVIEYTKIMEELNKWLEERKDENSSNKKI